MTQKNNPPAGPGAPLLQVRGLGRVYGRGEAAVTALQDVNFSVERGSFVSIVGPSGSGKSTLLHLIGGVDRPTAGTVFVDGTDLGALPESRLAVFRRRQIGLVYQFYNLIPALTVEENLTLPLLLADEPTGNLDTKNSAAILALLQQFHRQLGQTLLLITHDPAIARQADRVLSLRDGRLEKDEVMRP